MGTSKVPRATNAFNFFDNMDGLAAGVAFIASLIFLRMLQAHEFGQFSFLLIVVPFCLSAAGALLGAAAYRLIGRPDQSTSS